MLHPVFSVLVQRPDLLIDHLAGYAALVGQEATQFGTVAFRRTVAGLLALALFAVFLALAGVAAMLGALHGQFHWALVAVPGAVLALALVALAIARQPLPDSHFAEVGLQIDADLEALRRAGAAPHGR